MEVGDLVQTVEDWSYKTWTGIVLHIEKNQTTGQQFANVCWTETSVTQGNIFWAPTDKLEVVNESR